MPSHYQTLGVPPSASADEIRTAYRNLARRLHPDRHRLRSPAEAALAERRMRDVNEAWRVLGDPDRRGRYDADRRAAPSFSGQQAGDDRPVVPRTMAAAELALGYRRSAVAATQVVLAAELELAPGDRSAAEAAIAEIVRWRRAHQPGGTNAGSVFTNPPGDSAGRLVEAAGAKGLRLGSAQVSPKHGNFIQADDGGRAADVAELMAEVARRVREHSGVELVPETRMVGFESPVGSAR
jgi:curved DNA-binding protein CbpA